MKKGILLLIIGIIGFLFITPPLLTPKVIGEYFWVTYSVRRALGIISIGCFFLGIILILKDIILNKKKDNSLKK